MALSSSAPTPCQPVAKWSALHTVSLILITFVIGFINWFVPRGNHAFTVGLPSQQEVTTGRLTAWLITLALFFLFVSIAGQGITGLWRGLFIDQRNQISLSRLQLAFWTIVVLSGWITVVISNLAVTKDLKSLNVDIPKELWAALGISTISLIGTPLIHSVKKEQSPDPTEKKENLDQLSQKDPSIVNENPPDGVLVYKTCPSDSSLSDLFRGEETGNADHLDLGKVQLFYFTLVLVLSYAVAIGVLMNTIPADKSLFIASLPPLSAGFVALMGISHAGYLSNKAVPHSKKGDGAAGSAAVPKTAVLDPITGPAGTVVTLTGTGFGTSMGAGQVTIDGLPIPVSAVKSWSDAGIQFTIPAGHPNGSAWKSPQPIKIGLNGVKLNTADSSGTLFFVVANAAGDGGSEEGSTSSTANKQSTETNTPPMSLTDLSPTEGPVGTGVTLTGTGFNASQGSRQITFDATPLLPDSLVSWGDTRIQFTIPSKHPNGTVWAQGQQVQIGISAEGTTAPKKLPFTVKDVQPVQISSPAKTDSSTDSEVNHDQNAGQTGGEPTAVNTPMPNKTNEEQQVNVQR